MIQSKQVLDMLASQLNLTSLDDNEIEAYILTPDEEKEAIEFAIKMEKESFVFRRLDKRERLESIENKIAAMDWESQINKDDVLKRCNSNKHHAIWQKKKRDEEKDQKEKLQKELASTYTAKFVFNFMAWTSKNVFNKDLKVKPWNAHLISTICFYISNDPRFETELKYSFKKGLLIRGISGLGKTFLFTCVMDNEIKPINIFSMIEISEAVAQNGFFDLPNDKVIYLDDVGTEEPVVNHYGTKINYFKNFIEKYYLKNSPFNRLIISTNNNFQQLEEKYGFRVRSRIKDMFNIIDVDGEDMRGDKL